MFLQYLVTFALLCSCWYSNSIPIPKIWAIGNFDFRGFKDVHIGLLCNPYTSITFGNSRLGSNFHISFTYYYSGCNNNKR